jgi:predicted transposase YbfD/YdcC
MLLPADRPRLRVLLDHFAAILDDREPWRVAHPLPEVLLLVVCGTIAACDDFEDIADWGEAHLSFLRRFLPYYHGVPGARWLAILMNRIDPGLFSDCFLAWVREMYPQAPDLVAIDGKTSRRSHDRGRGRGPLHLVSAFATRERLVLGQEAVAEGSCEQDTIPILLERLAAAGSLKGAIVSIDAIACNGKNAAAILAAGADYVLAVKANQPGLMSEMQRFFADPARKRIDVHVEADKGHGRVEERRTLVATDIDWLTGERRYPGEYRFPKLAAIAMVEALVHEKGATRKEQRFYIASRAMPAADFAAAVRGHWMIENSLHWVLDVVFKEDLARTRTGHGPANMAVIRHFALNLVRSADDKKSIKLRRKRAGWDTTYLAKILASLSR